MRKEHAGAAGTAFALAAVLAVGLPLLGGDDPGWPREIPTSKGGTITVYEPQLESLKGDVVRFRAAVSYLGPGKKEPVFGVTWIMARLMTDRDNRTVTTSGPLIERTRFPEITPEREKKFADRVNPAIRSWSFTLSLDRFTALLAAAEREQRSAQGLKADPPKILVRKDTSVLVPIDGEPKTEAIPGSSLRRVVNTPVAIVLDTKSTQYYTSNGRFWYAAPAATGPYADIPNPPADVEKVVREAIARAPKQEKQDVEDEEQPASPPKLVVTTEPAELISFDGEPAWKPVTGTDLLYATNTASQIFKDLGTQQTYALLTGRWFTAKTFDGPWTYVPADKLPEDFAKIPPESDEGAVRANVAGTDEAEEALLDAQIPQTTAIDRESATLTVTYDGEPRFEAVPGAGIAYAVNSPISVLEVKGKYYACDQAVWYVSASPNGPWEVSDRRPDEVDAIPPSSPVYNVKYVYIYDSTPSVVYVGYTPGYIGCYPWGPTVVWGTGYVYRPWYGAYYYPRPFTWGLGVHYNPWTGWSMGIGWSNAFFSFGTSWNTGGGWYGRYPHHHGGWYGPGGYRPVYGYRQPGYSPGHRPGYPGYRPGYPPSGHRPGYAERPTPYASNNLYRRPQNKMRNAPAAKLPARRPTREAPVARPSARDVGPGTATAPTTREIRPGTRDLPDRRNDVYAGRDGNVYRKGADSWQKRGKGGWQNDLGVNQQLQRDARARDRGNQRAQSFQQSRPQQSQPKTSRPQENRPQPDAPKKSRQAPQPRGSNAAPKR